MVERLARESERRYGLERSRLLLTYSHNHCAPVTTDVLPDYYPLEPEEWREVEAYSRNMPRRSCTITEWMNAVPVSHGSSDAFSTGSQPQ